MYHDLYFIYTYHGSWATVSRFIKKTWDSTRQTWSQMNKNMLHGPVSENICDL